MVAGGVHVDIQVRFRDTDAMGHVNNAVYLSYLELARMEYWKRLVGEGGSAKPEIVLTRVEFDYRSPVVLGDSVRVHVRVAEVGRVRFKFAYRVEKNASGELVGEGFTEQAFFDYALGKPRAVDPRLRERIREIDAI